MKVMMILALLLVQSVHEDTSTVYIYRNKKLIWGSAIEPPVYVDGVEVARMDNGRYFAVRLKRGTHTIQSSNYQQTTVKLDLELGETYFVRIDLVSDVGWGPGRGRPTLVQPQVARTEVHKLRYLGADKIRDAQAERILIQ